MCVRFNVLDLFKEGKVQEALCILELVCEGKVVAIGDHHESPCFDLLWVFEFPVLSFNKVFILLVWIFWELDGAFLEVHVEDLELFFHSARRRGDCQLCFKKIVDSTRLALNCQDSLRTLEWRECEHHQGGWTLGGSGIWRIG